MVCGCPGAVILISKIKDKHQFAGSDKYEFLLNCFADSTPV